MMVSSSLAFSRGRWGLRISNCVTTMLLAGLLLEIWSCAQKTSAYEKELSNWIVSEPRSLVVSASAKPVEPKLFTEESNTGSKAIGGAAQGAGAGLSASLDMAADCHGDLCGAAIIVFTPVFIITGTLVGGIAGAVSAETTEVPYSLPMFEERLKDVETKMYSAKLAVILSKQIAGHKNEHTEGFDVRWSKNFMKANPASEMLMRVGIERFAFIFDDPGDTDARISLDASGEVTFPIRKQETKCLGFVREAAHYESNAEAIEYWTDNGLAALRSELNRALEFLANDLENQFFFKSEHDVKMQSKSLMNNVPSGFENCSKISVFETKNASMIREKKPVFSMCSDAKNLEQPWLGRWKARTGATILIFDIEEGKVRGELKSGSKNYPIFGTVNDQGAVGAKIFGRGNEGGPVDVRGTFPHLQLSYPYAQGPLFKALDGQTISLCS